MTPIELRTKYRLETGRYPTYEKDEDNCCKLSGKINGLYAIWLEADDQNLRLQYQSNTGNIATWTSRYGKKHFTEEYMIWLEDYRVNQHK